MKKRYIISTAGTIGASAVVGYLLSSKKNRDKLKAKANMITKDIINRTDENEQSILEEAGVPGAVENPDLADLENAKMVDEGSQYGVEYYNETREEDPNF